MCIHRHPSLILYMYESIFCSNFLKCIFLTLLNQIRKNYLALDSLGLSHMAKGQSLASKNP